MSPELKRAIIKFVPDYFSWDKKRQEQYRVDIPEEDAFKIKQFLLRELFDISVSSDDEVEEAWGTMNEAQSSNDLSQEAQYGNSSCLRSVRGAPGNRRPYRDCS